MKFQVTKRIPAFQEFVQAIADNAVGIFKASLPPEVQGTINMTEAIFHGQMFMLGTAAAILSDLCDNAELSEEEGADLFMMSWGIDIEETEAAEVEQFRTLWRSLRALPGEVAVIELGETKEKEDEGDRSDV